MDFFERQHQAKQHSRRLILYFVLAVLLIIVALNALTFGIMRMTGVIDFSAKEWLYHHYSLIATGIGIGIILIGSLFRHMQVRGGGQAVADMVGARQIDMDTKDPKERRLVNVVEEMSIASGMPVPSIYIMDNEAGMNAFVAGLVPSDTVLVVTEGLMNTLSRQELQGVVAHEFSHIFHADMRINVRLIGILGGILAIGQLGYYLLRSMRFSGGRSRSRSSNSGQAIIFILALSVSLITIGYIGVFFGRLIKAAISRQREYLADAAAVQYSRDAMGIANALYKIKTNGTGSLLDSSHAEDMSHMCFGKSVQLSAFSGLLATHPPIDDRIAALVPGYRSIRRQMDEAEGDDLSPIAQFSAAQPPQTDTEISTTGVSQASDVIASIGTVSATQYKQAQKTHDQLPEELLKSTRRIEEVSLVVLALISQANGLPWEEQSKAIDSRLNTKQLQRIQELQQIPLAPEHRIPLLEIGVPTLKRLSAENAKTLLACASLLIVADKKIIPFEFFLYALLRKHLSEKDAGFAQGNYRRFKPVLEEIEYVVSIIALAGDNFDPIRLANIMKSFDSGWSPSNSAPKFDAKRLNNTLSQLNRLTPLLKKPLMLTLSELVMSDGVIKTTELELLRATAIYLECPIPPLEH